MTDMLSRLSPAPGARHAERRVGRGPGCGVGKTCGRGSKGQKARQPGNLGKVHFQGGQTPLQRRAPKRGFNVPFPVAAVSVNVGSLDRFDAGSVVDETLLRSVRLVQGKVDRIKILGMGDLTKALTVSAHGFSKSAVAKIEQAGGKVITIRSPAEPEAVAS